jgi:hypothetical protein
MLLLSIFILLFGLNMVCMYLVKDYRNGIQYKGLVGKIQNLIKH